MGARRGNVALHLSEHKGDAQPGTLLYFYGGRPSYVKISRCAFGMCGGASQSPRGYIGAKTFFGIMSS